MIDKNEDVTSIIQYRRASMPSIHTLYAAHPRSEIRRVSLPLPNVLVSMPMPELRTARTLTTKRVAPHAHPSNEDDPQGTGADAPVRPQACSRPRGGSTPRRHSDSRSCSKARCPATLTFGSAAPAPRPSVEGLDQGTLEAPEGFTWTITDIEGADNGLPYGSQVVLPAASMFVDLCT